MYTDHVISAKEHNNWLNNLESNKQQIVFAIIDHCGDPLGIVSANNIDSLHKKTDWGFYLTKDARGGLGSIVEFNFIDFIFGSLDIKKLEDNKNLNIEKDKEIKLLQIEVHNLRKSVYNAENARDDFQEKYKKEFQQVVNNSEIQSLEKLSQGISYIIYYKTNETEIQKDVQPKIKQLAELIKPYPQIKIQIAGYADHRGSLDFNLLLSKKRVDKVRAAFVNAGISNKRFQLQAHGERAAVAHRRSARLG